MTIGSSHRMHVALDVRDLERSIAFYTALMDAAPAKRRDDYAKFESPGLVLALNLVPEKAPGGALSHLGFRVDSDAVLASERKRLVDAGVEITLDEDETTCCYAVQNKFWVADPDGNAWEIYRFVEDATLHSDAASTEARSAIATGGSSCCPGSGSTC